MASKILDLIIKVTDQATAELKDIKGSTTGDGSGIEGLSSSMLELAGKSVIAGMALQKIYGYVSENIEDFTGHVLEVHRLSEAFGLTTEEGEELVLLAGAMGVSNDALFSTMNKLAREGFGTGTEALDKLRVAFQEIEDPADRSQFLLGMAGVQGQQALGPLMTMSELEFIQLIEGIEALKGIDEEMVDNATDLEMASQGVEKAWTNLKLELMDFSAPGLTKLLEALTAFMTGDFGNNMYQGGFLESYRDLKESPYSKRWEGTESQRADAMRWNEMTDALRNLPNDIRDAVERSGDGLR